MPRRGFTDYSHRYIDIDTSAVLLHICCKGRKFVSFYRVRRRFWRSGSSCVVVNNFSGVKEQCSRNVTKLQCLSTHDLTSKIHSRTSISRISEIPADTISLSFCSVKLNAIDAVWEFLLITVSGHFSAVRANFLCRKLKITKMMPLWG